MCPVFLVLYWKITISFCIPLIFFFPLIAHSCSVFNFQKYTILFFNVYTEHHVSCLSSLPLQAESRTASLYHTFQHIYISPTIQHNQCLSHMLMFSRTPVFHQHTTFSFSSATIFTACSFSTPFSNSLPPLLSQQGFTPFWV